MVVYADDLGYGDVSCYNPERGKIQTPHIDPLASDGMRFTDAHSSSGVCSPSRYTLLTGRYHWRTRLQSGIVGLWGGPLIQENRLTVASLLEQHGYRTACVGKWHLGWDWPIPADRKAFFRRAAKDARATEVRWPGVVKAGSTNGRLVHQADWMATFAELLEASLPEGAGEDEQPGQLYQLANDLGETTNLYEQHPDVVNELTSLMGRIVENGRSTPGPKRANDVEVRWRRFMKSDSQ